MDYLKNLTEKEQIDFFLPDNIDEFLYSIKTDSSIILDIATIVNCYATCSCTRVFVPIYPFINSFKNYYKDYEKIVEILDYNPYCSTTDRMCGFCHNEIVRAKF